MKDSGNVTPPAKDVRALFEKASIGSMRYLTFSKPKAAEKAEAEAAPAPVSEPVPLIAAPSQPIGPRRALESAFEASTVLRTGLVRNGLSAGSKCSMAFGSCAGGVGKTTLCATVARAFSARMARVLVADRSTESILPYFFSLERLTAGGLQTAYPNARRPGYPLTLVVAPQGEQPIPTTAAWLEQLLGEAGLTLVDLPVFYGRGTPEVLDRGGMVVVVLAPDVQSVASLGRAEELAAIAAGGQAAEGKTLFVLNRFDETRVLHREIRTHLEQRLGDRLAPAAVRESEAVPEALSLGMTVLDHLPQSLVAREFEQVAEWLEARLTKEASAEKVEIG